MRLLRRVDIITSCYASVADADVVSLPGVLSTCCRRSYEATL